MSSNNYKKLGVFYLGKKYDISVKLLSLVWYPAGQDSFSK
jgi:hypothetical protein